jgi:hypothetical protein
LRCRNDSHCATHGMPTSPPRCLALWGRYDARQTWLSVSITISPS